MSANEKTLIQELKEVLKTKNHPQLLLTKEEQDQIVVYLAKIKDFYSLSSIFDFFGVENAGAQHGRLFFHDSEINSSRDLTEFFRLNKGLLTDLNEKIEKVTIDYSKENYDYIWNQILFLYLKLLENNQHWQSFWEKESRLLDKGKLHKAKHLVCSALCFKLFSVLSANSIEMMSHPTVKTFIKLSNCIDFEDVRKEMRNRLRSEIFEDIKIATMTKKSSKLTYKSLYTKANQDAHFCALSSEEKALAIIAGIADACLGNEAYFKLLMESFVKAKKQFPVDGFNAKIQMIFDELQIKNKIPKKYGKKFQEFCETQDNKSILKKALSLPQLSSVSSTFYHSKKREDFSNDNPILHIHRPGFSE
ncbi:hypothetical protein [Legionella pneumophila]|uniref:Uncharacterized protein n=1 Tax=Legionella pneumophila subsp. pascullei TaxID=91890 RepID=A0AAX2IYF5_LEGPN|nr:hypothetical protein [Legionella pneumophila]AMP89332.1 hypothetical protein AXF35_06425 [Legionella pneumophila subsp. pascullei]AMP93001.1 hypothetical protein AXF36_10370 [Legionella pneumophila subsp. pascullei]AMP95968.1 hypothetical protein AXF37_10265 [Legionella pneumophila subsp. pascullei]SQG90892.1 Uncharacterised protein [Legionella pneumophila subsp. pascullei]VEH07437.1 Uncharacterised protein [Legionella pneumophila subsp. pascullei]